MVKLFKFVVIGGAATLLQFFLLWALVKAGALTPTLASAVSYALSSIFNYLANYHFTFASNKNHKQTLPKFVVTVCIGMALNTTLYAVALFLLQQILKDSINLLPMAYLIAQLFATLLTLIVNFILHKFWIYRG